MSGIPEATPIILTDEKRADLEGLARATRTEHRLRQRAGIVLMAVGWGGDTSNMARQPLQGGGLQRIRVHCKRPLPERTTLALVILA
jgi:hypothetical protein